MYNLPCRAPCSTPDQFSCRLPLVAVLQKMMLLCKTNLSSRLVLHTLSLMSYIRERSVSLVNDMSGAKSRSRLRQSLLSKMAFNKGLYGCDEVVQPSRVQSLTTLR